MDVYALIFFVSAASMVAILGSKTYNVMNLGEFIGQQVAFLSFAGYFLAWFFMFLIAMANPEIIFYVQAYKLFTGMISINVLLFLCELFVHLKAKTPGVIKAYNAREARGVAR